MKKLISGKVREVYEISERELVIVTTDRISAFDVILPSIICGKGKALKEDSTWRQRQHLRCLISGKR